MIGTRPWTLCRNGFPGVLALEHVSKHARGHKALICVFLELASSRLHDPARSDLDALCSTHLESPCL